MCAVTFIPKHNGGAVFTSNRDVYFNRPTDPLKEYALPDGGKLYYPKDLDKFGTWAIFSSDGTAAILLNGAEKNHAPLPFYRKSRGSVLIDLFYNPNRPKLAVIEKMDFADIENCTVILFEQQKLYQIRWNGTHLDIQVLDAHKPYIWSSCTLYTAAVVEERKQWFEDFLSENVSKQITQSMVLHFHLHAGEEKPKHKSLKVDLPAIQTKTVSVTSFDIAPNKAFLVYDDILNPSKSVTEEVVINCALACTIK
ncbi:MAG: NRDE family protein [Phycisphaerales bacterium]|nr:NRDE family protein [Phycisphaerales bacterium]